MPQYSMCSKCSGLGVTEKLLFLTTKCSACNGEGKVLETDNEGGDTPSSSNESMLGSAIIDH